MTVKPGASDISLSVFTVVRNEARQISEFIQHLNWAHEIVVVDQASDDNTVALARAAGATVIESRNYGYCEPDRRRAAEACKGRWLLYLDADERVPDELSWEIQEIVSADSSQFDAFYIKRKTFYSGRWVRYSHWYPSRVVRLFRPGAVTFHDEIHSDYEASVPCGELRHDLHHFSYPSVSSHLDKLDRYTDQMALEDWQRGVRPCLWAAVRYVLLRPPSYALRRYIFWSGWRDGWVGLVIAAVSAVTPVIVYAKLCERSARTADAREANG